MKTRQKMKKVLLCPPLIAHVNSWRYCPYHTWKFSFSSGDNGYSGVNTPICMISAYLRDKGIEIDILDAFFENLSIRETVDRIKNYDFIAITVHSNVNLADIKGLVHEIRRLKDRKIIVLGGHYPTYFPEKTITETNCDFVVRGEGEITSYELIKCLESRGSLFDVEGISFKENGRIINNKPRKSIEDLNSLPFMSRDEYIRKEIELKFVPAISSSRGCAYSGCNFCDICCFHKASSGKLDKLWRGRSAKNVVDEIEFITKKWNFRKFKFLDPNFIGGQEGKLRAKQIAEEIIKRNLDVEYMFDTRVDEIDEDLFRLLHKSGLRMVYLGIESGIQRQLDYFNKGSTVKQNNKAISLLRKIGIIPLFGIVVFEPTTTIQEIRTNFEYFRKNGGFNIYRFARGIIPRFGTPLMLQFQKEGRLIEDFPDYKYSFDKKEVELLFRKVDEYAQKVFLVEKRNQEGILRRIEKYGLKKDKIDMLISLENKLKELTVIHFEKLLLLFEKEKIPPEQFVDENIKSYSDELAELFSRLEKEWPI